MAKSDGMQDKWLVGVVVIALSVGVACMGDSDPLTGELATGGTITGGNLATGGTLTGGSPTMSGSGGAGGMGGEVSPGSVTRGEDCVYRGNDGRTGGSDSPGCTRLKVLFYPELPSTGISATVATSDGDTFTVDAVNRTTALPGTPSMQLSLEVTCPTAATNQPSDPCDTETMASGLTFAGTAAQGHTSPHPYAPEWIEIELRQEGVLVASDKRYLSYRCEAITWDDWCWHATTSISLHTKP